MFNSSAHLRYSAACKNYIRTWRHTVVVGCAVGTRQQTGGSLARPPDRLHAAAGSDRLRSACAALRSRWRRRRHWRRRGGDLMCAFIIYIRYSKSHPPSHNPLPPTLIVIIYSVTCDDGTTTVTTEIWYWHDGALYVLVRVIKTVWRQSAKSISCQCHLDRKQTQKRPRRASDYTPRGLY